jgi:hypothetical protein
MVIIPQPPYLLDLAPCYFTFSKIKKETEGTMFWNSVWHPKGIASSTRQYWGKWLPRRSWSVKKIIGSLYTFPRRLFWKRWQTKLSKLIQHFFFDIIQEFSDIPHIVFTQGNTPNCVLNTVHLPASTTSDTDHITSKAHSTCYQVMDRYEKFAVNLVTLPHHPTQTKEK